MRITILPLLVVLVAGNVQARDWLVPAEAPTIAAGLDSASTGDHVVVSCGTYEETNLQLKPGVTLRSESGTADCATIDATNVAWPISVVQCWWADGARLEGFTITGGHALDHYYGDHGGGLKITGADLEVTDCTFTGNEAYAGGAVTVSGYVAPVFRRCVITGNTAWIGGGIEVFEGSVLTAYDCVINNNTGNGAAPDGLLRTDSLARLVCCDIDLDRWSGDGVIEVIDEDCGFTRTDAQTWSAVKGLFR